VGVEEIEIFWEPLNLFRMSPSLFPDDLALLVGIGLAWITAAMVLGIRGSQPQSTAWHGLLLVALAGCLAMTMATNLLTLALASALLDLSLIAMAVFAPGDAARVVWRMVVPGIVSTMLILLGALFMDAQVGTASFLAREIPVEVLVLLSIAGVLRLLIFPLHPRGLQRSESAASLLLSIGAGIYLLARAQAIGFVLTDLGWLSVVGAASMVAGGLLAWFGAGRTMAWSTPATQWESPSSTRAVPEGAHVGAVEGQGKSIHRSQPALSRAWPGAAIQQASFAFLFLFLVGASGLWAVMGLTLALGTLAIWWDGSREMTILQGSQPLVGMGESAVASGAAVRFPVLDRWRESRVLRYGMALLPVLALASLAGVPLTVGAAGRWPFYGNLLGEGQSITLLGAVLADSFLIAGLIAALTVDLNRVGGRRPSPAAFVGMLALVVPLVVLGVAPGVLDVEPIAPPDVSVWGLGFLYLLPWLVGAWLARVGIRLAEHGKHIYGIINLDWLYRASAWLGRKFLGALHWVGQVGEGEGWFGWVLVILAVGIVLLIVR
jgi:hypothetical protein